MSSPDDVRDPRLDRAYGETPREEPPLALDERIRAAARRAAGARPQSLERQAARQRSWSARWRLPLSVAATVVIAATLTVMVQDEERRPRDDTPERAPPANAPAATPTAPEAPPAAAAPRPAAEPRAPAASGAEGARRDIAPPPAAAPSAATPVPAPVENKREERGVAMEQQPPAADSTSAVPPAGELQRQTPAQRNVTPPAAAPAPVPAPIPPPPARESEGRRVVPSTPAPPMQAPEPITPAAKPAPPGGPSDPFSRDRALSDRPPRAAREVAPSVVRTPETWVEEIRQLYAEGRAAEAAAALAAFRREYPDFRLPPDLAR